jgi:hypothetical protein
MSPNLLLCKFFFDAIAKDGRKIERLGQIEVSAKKYVVQLGKLLREVAKFICGNSSRLCQK